MRATTFLLFGTLLLAACGDDGSSDSADSDTGVADTGGSDASADVSGSDDASSGVDTSTAPSPDATPDPDVGPDPDVSPEPDATPEMDAAVDTGTDDAEPCTADGTLCVTLNVPEDYAGTPDRFFIGLYTSLPPTGPPNGFLPAIASPEVTAGEPYEARIEGVGDTGDFLLYVVLYDVDGGQFTPEAGVDFVGWSDAAVTFDGGPVNHPPIDLMVAP